MVKNNNNKLTDECLLCKIANKEIKNINILYESENIIIVENECNATKIHLTAITKKHLPQKNLLVFPNLFSDLSCNIDKLFPLGWRLIINYGRDSHQTTEHAHVHIVGGETLQEIGFK